MALPDPTTKIDPQGRTSWHINDVLVRLRLWATEYAHPLPEPRTQIVLGSAPTCDVQLHDDTGLLSREHARLTPGPNGWEIYDLGSKNGLKIDGAPSAGCPLQVGVKIQLGGLVLVAESLKFIGLRSFVCRLMGWAAERQASVDEALQSIRDWALQHTPVVLLGDEDLAPVAARLHRETFGAAAPFVTFDNVDATATVRDAGSGTLCVPIIHRGAASAIVDAVHAIALPARPRLVLCASSVGDVAAVSTRPGKVAVIAVPPLSERTAERSRLVHETGAVIAREMNVPATGFTMHDLERFESMSFSGTGDLEDTIRRVIAMRTWGLTAGASRLGLKHSSLSQWARNKNRKLCT